jgi:hypothetical protein
MLRQIILYIIIVAIVSALPTDFATAQQPQVIHFQGLLVGPDGGPLQTDIYEVNFSIWDHATNDYEPLWSEIQMVEATDGLFDVFLGSVDSLSADVFTPFDGEDIGLRYLEIEVVGDEPMTPRIQIGKTPNSFVSSRVLGDVVTGPGSLKLMDPSYPEIAGIDMRVDTTEHNLIFWTPQFPWIPAMEMIANGTTNSFKINWMEPPDIHWPAIEMEADAASSSIRLMDPIDGGLSLIEMNGGIGSEATLRMFNPQPEPPAVLMEMSSSPLTGASFRMFNPQPEPPADPLLEMNTTEFGANLAMGAPGAGGLGTDITDPMVEIISDSNGGAINLYDEIGQYMGFEPTPFMPGGGLSMMDPSTDQANVWIGSDGRVSARKGIFGHNNTNDGNYNLAVGRYHSITGSWGFAGGYNAQVDHNNCFVWSDYLGDATAVATSDSNQFLVRSTGGVAFYTNSQLTYGVSLGPGDYTWNSILPALTARNSHDVDGFDILDKIERLPIRQFTVESENNQIKHISPVAEDFNRLFGVGEDDNRISMLDPSGVALAGVQALLDKIEKLETRIAELEAERR